MGWELVDGDGKGWPVYDRSIIGRSSRADICLDDPLISRHQCEFRIRGSELKVYDLGSTNGTWVNGVRVADSQVMYSGNSLRVGQTTLWLRWVSERAEGHLIEPPADARRPASRNEGRQRDEGRAGGWVGWGQPPERVQPERAERERADEERRRDASSAPPPRLVRTPPPREPHRRPEEHLPSSGGWEGPQETGQDEPAPIQRATVDDWAPVVDSRPPEPAPVEAARESEDDMRERTAWQAGTMAYGAVEVPVRRIEPGGCPRCGSARGVMLASQAGLAAPTMPAKTWVTVVSVWFWASLAFVAFVTVFLIVVAALGSFVTQSLIQNTFGPLANLDSTFSQSLDLSRQFIDAAYTGVLVGELAFYIPIFAICVGIPWFIRRAVNRRYQRQMAAWQAAYDVYQQLQFCGDCVGVFLPRTKRLTPVEHLQTFLSAWARDNVA